MARHYFEIIQKNLTPETYHFYVPHVILVTHLALTIARKLQLDSEQQLFIEEASMLHDIGIGKVNAPSIGCNGGAPYIQHGVIGREILEQEGLPKHGLVAERHSAVGYSVQDITEQSLPLPLRDMQPVSLEEEIICYADKWYSKSPHKLWKPYTLEEIIASIRKYPRAEERVRIFTDWHQRFSQ